MPGMPIFQEFPGQLKGVVYAQDTDNNILPILVDAGTGYLQVGGSVDLDAGAEVALAAGTTVGLTAGTEVGLASGATVALASGTEVGLASGTTVGLASGTTVGLTAGTSVALADGTTVGLAAGTNMIGSVQHSLSFTSVDAFGGATILTPKTVDASATVYADAQDISQQSSYNWYIKNNGTITAQDVTLIVEISPDNTNWVADTGVTISLAHNTAKMITVTNFLQYARYTITGGTAETTVISCFQAQH